MNYTPWGRKLDTTERLTLSLFNITNNQGNENKNHNEVPFYACYNGHCQNDEITNAGEYVEKMISLCTSGGIVN